MTLPDILVAGHRHFREGFPGAEDRYRQLATEGQKPPALVIGCCDSRSAPESIFGSGPGELFVVRNVANIVPPYQPDAHFHGTSAAIEYAVDVLEVEHVLVLGHAGCGGIQAALGNAPRTDSAFIGNWVLPLTQLAGSVQIPSGPAAAKDRATALERLSVLASLVNLRTFPFVSERENAGRLALHAGWFDIPTGRLWVHEDDVWQVCE